MGFRKCQDKFEQSSWSRKDSKYLEEKLKVCKRNDNKELQLVQCLTNGETDFNQFMRLRSQLVIVAENFVRQENLSTVLKTKIPKDMEEQSELAHKAFNVVDRANRKLCVTLLRYNVDKPEGSYSQVQIFGTKKEDEKFQQIVYVECKFQKFIYLLDLLTSVVCI